MNVAVFSAKRYDREFLDAANASVGHRITYFDVPPERETAALEADLFFRDLSSDIISDDVFQRLISFPNVIVTGHQAFFTREAVSTICETTIKSISEFAAGQSLTNEIKAQ